jgi:thiamine biosynthesis lipoprotein
MDLPSRCNRMSDVLIHVSRRAMACEFEVRFPAARYPHGTELALQALDPLESLEEELSFFRPASRISRINLLAAEDPVEVSPATFALLQQCVTLFEETDGAYDITAAPLWETWGFARRKGEVPSEAQLAEARALVGCQWLELDATRRTIRFRRPGMRINLGSIGKGFALDVCGEQLTTAGMADFLFHGGQSSILARGSQSTDACWEVGVRHPTQSGRRLGVVRLHDRALGTSSGQFQSFRYQGRRYHHILDPRTGLPADAVLATTVIAPTATLADALSTAFFVLGPDRASAYCEKHPDIGAIIICPGRTDADVTIHTAGLAANRCWFPLPPGEG